TFTDVVVASSDGRISVQKLLSTPKDYSVAVVEGLLAGLADLGLEASRKSEIVHATTIATNTILEGTGARCALITTRGFRDVLEIGRLRFPTLYDFRYEKPKPLVLRQHVFEATERINAKGSVSVALARDEIDRVVNAVAGSACEAVAISLLNTFANPAHERLLAQAVRERLPGIDLSVSSEILPQIGEYERTSTTAINAYIMPRVRRYLTALVDRLRGSAVRGALLVMRSGGGIMGVERAVREPVHMVESGPVAGVLASRRILGWAGLDDLLTVDVGGTTAKASIVEGGRFLKTVDYEVGGAVSATTRLAGGGGYPIQIPVIDIAEVGAGGGSIVWVDSGGSPQVGPRSAGADPGPVCYGRGGDQVTLTDANLLLGYLNQDRLAGGVALQRGLAERAMREQIAKPLGLSLEAAAYGVFRIANAQMMGAIRAVSTQRGRDVRGYALAAFGGNGPVHAAELASAIGISTVVVPRSPGVFSATGLLVTDLEYDATRVLYRNHSELEPAALNQVLAELRDRIEAL
ncbi:MAG: hydantoinase/oxoprolinase family protein, partial [Alphaproteobacteria bacterium]|nr:hydantoinase/oxoprolinase family protein [Alphaproteobacteria bacterium]